MEADLDEALVALAALRERWRTVRATGDRIYNPGWHLVFELDHLLTISEAITRSAKWRTESRGAHSRLDYPGHRRRRLGPRQHGRRPRRRWLDDRVAGAPSRDEPRAARAARQQRPLGRRIRCRTHICGSSGAARAKRAISTSSTSRSRRGWSSSTPSTGSRATRRPTSPSAGTARPPSAARAAPRSTGARA